ASRSLACALSDATISSTFSIGHCGRNDGFRSAPLDAPPPPSNRPCASSRKRRSSGPASEPTAQKSAKSSLEHVPKWLLGFFDKDVGSRTSDGSPPDFSALASTSRGVSCRGCSFNLKQRVETLAGQIWRND